MDRLQAQAYAYVQEANLTAPPGVSWEIQEFNDGQFILELLIDDRSLPWDGKPFICSIIDLEGSYELNEVNEVNEYNFPPGASPRLDYDKRTMTISHEDKTLTIDLEVVHQLSNLEEQYWKLFE
jgi:hypothetical protein